MITSYSPISCRATVPTAPINAAKASEEIKLLFSDPDFTSNSIILLIVYSYQLFNAVLSRLLFTFFDTHIRVMRNTLIRVLPITPYMGVKKYLNTKESRALISLTLYYEHSQYRIIYHQGE